MTNRQAHEEAAGYNLDDWFFRYNGIDPNAECDAPGNAQQQVQADSQWPDGFGEGGVND